MVAWLRHNAFARWILLVARLWLGWEWLAAALEKLGSPVWTGAKAGVGVNGFLNHAVSLSTGAHAAVQGWYVGLIKTVALPGATELSYLVTYGELLIGLALLLGCVTTFAALMGAVLNSAYLFAGTVSTNPNMLIIEVFVLIAGFNAAKIGIDYWLIPWIRAWRSQGTPRKDPI